MSLATYLPAIGMNPFNRRGGGGFAFRHHNCIECGADTTHNNAWCSPLCCKSWRAKEKVRKAEIKLMEKAERIARHKLLHSPNTVQEGKREVHKQAIHADNYGGLHTPITL